MNNINLRDLPHYDLAVEISELVIKRIIKSNKLEVYDLHQRFVTENKCQDNWAFAYAESVMRSKTSGKQTVFYTDDPILLEFDKLLFQKYGVEVLASHKDKSGVVDYISDGSLTGNTNEKLTVLKEQTKDTNNWWKSIKQEQFKVN